MSKKTTGSPAAKARGAKAADVEIARSRHRSIANSIDSIVGLFRTVIRSGSFVLVAWLGYKTMGALAGKTTTVNSVVDWALAVSADRWVAYIVSILCAGGWYMENRLRRKTIKDHAGYIKELEALHDPNRSSSGLLLDGIPPKEKDGE